jgi:hypothetical protein
MILLIFVIVLWRRVDCDNVGAGRALPLRRRMCLRRYCLNCDFQMILLIFVNVCGAQGQRPCINSTGQRPVNIRPCIHQALKGRNPA